MNDRTRALIVGEILAELDTLELTVEKLVAGGDGFARHRGIPFFIPLSAPGDRVRVQITERKAGYARAEIVEILEPSEHRVEPRCRHFGQCGGCDLQHLSPKAQLRFKAAAVLETLAHIGHLQLTSAPRIVAGDPWGYRLRCQVHTSPSEEESVRVGYHARGSNELVPISECPVLEPGLEKVVTTLAHQLPTDSPRRIDLATGDDGLSVAPVVGELPHRELVRQVGDFRYHFDARCFFQAHRGLLSSLVDAVIGEATGSVAYDLYAGVGLFSLPLAKRYERVVAVEGDRTSVRYAKKNARLHRLDRVEVRSERVEGWIAALPANADRVVIDPPRTGLHRSIRNALLEQPPQRLTYTSCHPATLGRDLKTLQRVFDIAEVTLLDLFPQTGHMEVVVQMVRRPPPVVTAPG